MSAPLTNVGSAAGSSTLVAFNDGGGPASFQPTLTQGQRTYIGIPPDGAVRWELGTVGARTVLKGPSGTYDVPLAAVYGGRDAIRAWAVTAWHSGAIGGGGNHYGGASSTAGSLSVQRPNPRPSATTDHRAQTRRAPVSEPTVAAVGARAPDGRGLQGDLVFIGADKQWALKGTTELYRMPASVQLKSQAIAYAKQRIQSGEWSLLRPLDPRSLGGSGTGKQTSQYLKPLRDLIARDAASVNAAETWWAEDANTKNLGQRFLDNPLEAFGVVNQPGIGFGDGFKLYDDARSGLDRVYQDVYAGRINSAEGHRRIDALMAGFDKAHAQRVASFGDRAQVGATVVRKIRDVAPTAAAFVAKGFGGSLAASFVTREAQDYAAWWLHNKSGLYDAGTAQYAAQPDAAKHASNLLGAFADAIFVNTLRAAPPLLQAAYPELPAWRSMGNAFVAGDVFRMPVDLLKLAVEQQFSQRSLQETLTKTSATFEQRKQTVLKQQADSFAAQRPKWLHEQAVAFENQKQNAIATLSRSLAQQQQAQLAQARTQLAGAPAEQRQRSLDQLATVLEQKKLSILAQMSARYEAQRQPRNAEAAKRFDAHRASETRKLSQSLEQQKRAAVAQAQTVLDKARAAAPGERTNLVGQNLKQMPISYATGGLFSKVPVSEVPNPNGTGQVVVLKGAAAQLGVSGVAGGVQSAAQALPAPLLPGLDTGGPGKVTFDSVGEGVLGGLLQLPFQGRAAQAAMPRETTVPRAQATGTPADAAKPGATPVGTATATPIDTTVPVSPTAVIRNAELQQLAPDPSANPGPARPPSKRVASTDWLSELARAADAFERREISAQEMNRALDVSQLEFSATDSALSKSDKARFRNAQLRARELLQQRSRPDAAKPTPDHVTVATQKPAAASPPADGAPSDRPTRTRRQPGSSTIAAPARKAIDAIPSTSRPEPAAKPITKPGSVVSATPKTAPTGIAPDVRAQYLAQRAKAPFAFERLGEHGRTNRIEVGNVVSADALTANGWVNTGLGLQRSTRLDEGMVDPATLEDGKVPPTVRAVPITDEGEVALLRLTLGPGGPALLMGRDGGFKQVHTFAESRRLAEEGWQYFGTSPLTSAQVGKMLADFHEGGRPLVMARPGAQGQVHSVAEFRRLEQEGWVGLGLGYEPAPGAVLPPKKVAHPDIGAPGSLDVLFGHDVVAKWEANGRVQTLMLERDGASVGVASPEEAADWCNPQRPGGAWRLKGLGFQRARPVSESLVDPDAGPVSRLEGRGVVVSKVNSRGQRVQVEAHSDVAVLEMQRAGWKLEGLGYKPNVGRVRTSVETDSPTQPTPVKRAVDGAKSVLKALSERGPLDFGLPALSQDAMPIEGIPVEAWSFGGIEPMLDGIPLPTRHDAARYEAQMGADIAARFGTQSPALMAMKKTADVVVQNGKRVVVTWAALTSTVTGATLFQNLVPEFRTTPMPSGKAEFARDIAALQANPDAYMERNYFDPFGNASGHLKLYKPPSGAEVLFRTVPDTLYKELLINGVGSSTPAQTERTGFVLVPEVFDGKLWPVEYRPPWRTSQKVVERFIKTVDDNNPYNKTTAVTWQFGPGDGAHISVKASDFGGTRTGDNEFTGHLDVNPLTGAIAWGDFREHVTTRLAAASLKFTPWSVETGYYTDLDSPSFSKISSAEILSTSLYGVIGARDRELVKFNFANPGNWSSMIRLTGAVEPGLMVNFISVGGRNANGQSIAASIRGYFEPQLYPLDTRFTISNGRPRFSFTRLNWAGPDVALEINTRNIAPQLFSPTRWLESVLRQGKQEDSELSPSNGPLDPGLTSELSGSLPQPMPPALPVRAMAREPRPSGEPGLGGAQNEFGTPGTDPEDRRPPGGPDFNAGHEPQSVGAAGPALAAAKQAWLEAVLDPDGTGIYREQGYASQQEAQDALSSVLAKYTVSNTGVGRNVEAAAVVYRQETRADGKVQTRYFPSTVLLGEPNAAGMPPRITAGMVRRLYEGGWPQGAVAVAFNHTHPTEHWAGNNKTLGPSQQDLLAQVDGVIRDHVKGREQTIVQSIVVESPTGPVTRSFEIRARLRDGAPLRVMQSPMQHNWSRFVELEVKLIAGTDVPFGTDERYAFNIQRRDSQGAVVGKRLDRDVVIDASNYRSAARSAALAPLVQTDPGLNSAAPRGRLDAADADYGEFQAAGVANRRFGPNDFRRFDIFKMARRQRLDATGQPMRDRSGQPLMGLQPVLDPRGLPVPNGLGKQFFLTAKDESGREWQLLQRDLSSASVQMYLERLGISEPLMLDDGRLLNIDRPKVEDLLRQIADHPQQVYLKMPRPPLQARGGKNDGQLFYSGRPYYTFGEMWAVTRETGRELAPFRSPGRPSKATFWTRSGKVVNERGQLQRLNFSRAEPDEIQWYLAVGPLERQDRAGAKVMTVRTPRDAIVPLHYHPSSGGPSGQDVKTVMSWFSPVKTSMVIGAHPEMGADAVRPFVYGDDPNNPVKLPRPPIWSRPDTWFQEEAPTGANPQPLIQRPRVPTDALPSDTPLPDGLRMVDSVGRWSIVNSDAMRQAVRADPGLFRGIHALVDEIIRTDELDPLDGKQVSVGAASNVPRDSVQDDEVALETKRGRRLVLQVTREFTAGSQSRVVQVAVWSPDDTRRMNLVLKVEHPSITNAVPFTTLSGTMLGHASATLTYPDMIKVQEVLKQDPALRDLMQRNRIEFAQWWYAIDAGNAPKLAPPLNRSFAIMQRYTSVGEPRPADRQAMDQMAALADAALARNPATRGIAMDLEGSKNYLVVIDAGVRKLIVVDPFTRLAPSQTPTRPRPATNRTTE